MNVSSMLLLSSVLSVDCRQHLECCRSYGRGDLRQIPESIEVVVESPV
jgi:hypothetical protein